MPIKLIKFNKRATCPILLVLLCAGILGMSLRGNPGNPSAEDLSSPQWKEDGPLELSPERGRFALTYSLAENHSLQFSLPIARFVLPDLAISASGKYVSLFAPGVSYAVLPGYFLGRVMGAAQIGTYAVISLFAIFNVLLIYFIAQRFGANRWAAALGGLVFLFATPAFAYAVNLYQHHISTCLLLAGIYILTRWRGWPALVCVWILCSLNIAVDNPNFFLMLPLGLFTLGRIVVLAKQKARKVEVVIKLGKVITLLALIPPFLLLLWFNQSSHGDMFKLSGTLPRVVAIDSDGHPAQSALAQELKLENTGLNKDKKAVNFFKTRNLLQGFYIHLLSPDRGIVYYAPVILLGILGLALLGRRYSEWSALLAAIAAVNFLLYSMWGDPWGGWAFGSRYLIPSYALLAVGIGIVLDYWRGAWWFLILFFTLFSYSTGVNTLGALTTSMNPPQAEVLNLEKVSGHEEKYTYARNWQYLNAKGSKSFLFQSVVKNHFSVRGYYYLILTGLFFGSALPLFFLARGKSQVKNSKV